MKCSKSCEFSFLESRKKIKMYLRPLTALASQSSCSCPVIANLDESLFPINRTISRSIDVFTDTLKPVSIGENVYSIKIDLDTSTNNLFPIENGSLKVPYQRNYSVRSIIASPSTMVIDFSLDINGSSGAGPIFISTINDLSLEIAVQLLNRSSIQALLRPTSIQVSPQGVTLGDGPMKIYVRVYFQIPPIPLFFHQVIPSNSLLSPTVLYRVAGNIYYSSSEKSVTVTYNNDLKVNLEGYTQPSTIEVLSI